MHACQLLGAQVGAGTMNPATFLRVLGPEPWAVCYVEPSVRPDDSRYGENPNRLQQHTQFQARAALLLGDGSAWQCKTWDGHMARDLPMVAGNSQ